MRIAAALLLPLLLAATPAPRPPLEALGSIPLPADTLGEIRAAASSQGLEIVAVETWKGDTFDGIFAYGPLAKAGSGLCRGAVSFVELQEKKKGAERWTLHPAADMETRLSYVLQRDHCRGSLASRVLVEGVFADADVAAILDAVRARKLDARWSVSILQTSEAESAKVGLTDATKPDETLELLVVRVGGEWRVIAPGDAP